MVFVSWSGGKDSCYAAYLAAENGLDIRYLLNMVNEDGQRSWTHGLSPEILELQSHALGVPLVQQRTSGEAYEAEFVRALRAFRQEGLSGGVFGDIDFEIHRQWIEGVCEQADMVPHLPLWGREQARIMEDFIGADFEAVVVVTKADLMGEEWLGRKLDREFLADLKKLPAVTPCGEAGEYHTLVTDGPLFRKRLVITETEKIFRDGYWFLDIKRCGLEDK